jgi:transcriptional regulator GlxA family with amidase domain
LPATLIPEDIIVLPGCDQSFSAYATCDAHQVIQWLKKVVVEQTVLTICSGAVLAAKAGLLVNKSCTTHYQLVDKMRVTFPESQVLDNRIFVEDANIISSAGISSGIDMAIYFVSSRFAEHIGAQVAREMLVYFRRTGQDPQLSCWMQYRNHMHRSIHKVQDVVCRDITQYYA